MYSWFVKLLSQIRARFLGKRLTDREFAEVNLELNLYATRGYTEDEEKVIIRTMKQTPVTATYDRSAPQRLWVTKNAPDCNQRKKDGQLRVYEGDKVQLLGTCALEGVAAWRVSSKLPESNNQSSCEPVKYTRVTVTCSGVIQAKVLGKEGKSFLLPFAPRGYCIDPKETEKNKDKQICIFNPLVPKEHDGFEQAFEQSRYYSELQELLEKAEVEKEERFLIDRPEKLKEQAADAVAASKTGDELTQAVKESDCLAYLIKDPSADDIAHCRILVSGGHEAQGANRGTASVGWVPADACQYEQPREPELKPSARHECFKLSKGRPNYEKIFDAIIQAHEGTEVTNIGVFCCGPMGKQLRSACLKKSKVEIDEDGNPVPGKSKIFKLHAEVF